MDLALEPGSLNVILGPTLAGKTSILRLMAGLDKPSGGRILIADGGVADGGQGFLIAVDWLTGRTQVDAR